MKKEYVVFVFITISYLFGSIKSVAQCIADAGPDAALCTFFGLDSFNLGGNPTALLGTPPYTYTWKANYTDEIFSHSASFFLNDTTIANPLIINFTEEPVLFELEVRDSVGNVCYDTTRIQFSSFIITTDVKGDQIVQGDSTQLHTSVYGGIPPLSYLWTPADGLTDPTNVYTWAKPNETTTYYLTVIDSAGCQMDDVFYVSVIPTGVVSLEYESLKFDLYPIPVSDIAYTKLTTSDEREAFYLRVYNLQGQLKKSIHIPPGDTYFDCSDLPAGMYYYSLTNRNGIEFSGIFPVN